MVFKNGVKNIQAAAYDGACTVYEFDIEQSQHRLLTKFLIGILFQNMLN